MEPMTLPPGALGSAASFANRTVVVTGAGEGIGRAIAEGFATAGARVVIADIRDPAATVDAFRAAGHAATGIACDVADEASVAAMAAHAVDAFGSIDVLVNNAGIFTSLLPKRLEDTTLDEWERVFAVNVRGVFLCCRAVVGAMRTAGGGAIVNIGSATTFKGNPLMLHYIASKSAILGMTRSLARELGPDGIRVNCVAPGYTLSDGMLRNDVQLARGRQKNVNERCVGRDMYPADLAGAVRFLASPDAAFISGQTLVVDGGVALH